MSETDSFIEEVTEEVRRERLFHLMKKYGWIAVLAILGIVGGSAWNEYQKAEKDAAAQAFGDQVLASIGSEDRLAALEAITAQGAPRAALRAMLIAGEAQSSGNTGVALAELAKVAGDSTLPVSLRDLAKLKTVMIGADTLEPAARDQMLAELSVAGAPYRGLAMEQQALILVNAGDIEAAVIVLRQILAEAGATPALQRRATELMVALGADPAAE